MKAAAAISTMNVGSEEIMDEHIYDRLHGRAKAILRRETSDHRLEPADLVHEAFLRIAKSQAPLHFHDGGHLMAVATTVMRRILIDNARSACSPRRYRCVPLDSELPLSTDSGQAAYVIRDALQRLSTCNARLYWIVVMRFFWGLDLEEIAGALSISSRTVKRDWTVARVWLRGELGKRARARQALPTCVPHVASSQLSQQNGYADVA